MKPCWDDRAREHIAKHGITTDEVDFVLARVRRPFPNDIGHGKWLVRGKTSVGRWIQVI